MHIRAILSVIGGILIHIILGTIYTWGNLNMYIISYVRHHGSPVHYFYYLEC